MILLYSVPYAPSIIRLYQFMLQNFYGLYLYQSRIHSAQGTSGVCSSVLFLIKDTGLPTKDETLMTSYKSTNIIMNLAFCLCELRNSDNQKTLESGDDFKNSNEHETQKLYSVN